MMDFYKFCRSLRLKIFFSDKKHKDDKTNSIPPKFKKKSKFDPQINNQTLEIFEQVVTTEVLKQWDNAKNKKICDNLIKQE